MKRYPLKIVFTLASMSVGLIVIFLMTQEVDHHERLDSLVQKFDENPSDANLRQLINYPSDGDFAYYHIALIGQSFTKHTNSYKILNDDLRTNKERFFMNSLASLGDGIFQYFPELKPDDFDRCFHDNQSWLHPKPDKSDQNNGRSRQSQD